MSEPESTPPKPSLSLAELARYFEGISKVAASEEIEVVEPDPLSLVGEEDLDKERVATEIERLREELRQTKRLNKARLIVLTALFSLIVLWLVSVMALTAAVGFHWWGFFLSDKVVMTYITSTTVSVLGLFHIAARWLFSVKS
jgi:hypothetical protein